MKETHERTYDLTEDLIKEPFLYEEFCEQAIQHIRNWENHLDVQESESTSSVRAIHYAWAFDLKEYSVLVRDLCFDLFRMLLTEVTEKNLEIYRNEASAVIEAAGLDLRQSYQSLKRNEGLSIHSTQNWKHYKNPIEQIKSQTEEIQGQIQQLSKVYRVCLSWRQQISGLQSRVTDHIRSIKDYLDTLGATFKKATDHEKELKSDEEISNLKPFLKELGAKMRPSRHHNLEVEGNWPTGKKVAVPIAKVGTRVQYKELDINVETRQWIEKKIIPVILNCEDIEAGITAKTNQLIATSQNRIELADSKMFQDFEELRKTILIQWINHLSEILAQREAIDHATEKLFDSRYYPSLTQLFDPDRLFISDREQLSFGTEAFRIADARKKLGSWFSYGRAKLEWLVLQLLRQGNLRTAFDVRSYLEWFSTKREDVSVDSLFKFRGYLGETFTVARPTLRETLTRDMALWRQGYRAGCLVVGNTLSGKTTFLKSAEQLFPFAKVVNVSPQNATRFDGRMLAATCKLEDVLSFISKHTLGRPVVVILDDLEMWRNEDVGLYENVSALFKFILRNYSRMYFVVSTNHFFYQTMVKLEGLNVPFTSVIYTDQSTAEEIEKAIRVRDETVFQGVQGSHERLSGVELKRLTAQAIRKSGKNIGTALALWPILRAKKEDQGLRVPGELRTLCDRYKVILQYVLRMKISSEKEMLRIQGNEFLKLESNHIQYLLGLGIFLRNDRGQISINECLVGPIEQFYLSKTP